MKKASFLENYNLITKKYYINNIFEFVSFKKILVKCIINKNYLILKNKTILEKINWINKSILIKKNNLIKNLIKHFIKFFIKNGKKNKITKIIFFSLNIIKYNLLKKNILLTDLLYKIIKNLKHGLGLKKIQKSGKKYFIPYCLLYNKKNKHFFFKLLKKNIYNKNTSLKNNLNKLFSENIQNYIANPFIEKRNLYNKDLKENQAYIQLIKKK